MIPHSKPAIGAEEQTAVTRVLASGHLAQGPEVEGFEEEIAAFTGRRFGVAVSSGTAALHLALAVSGIGAQDTVALPSYACAALLQPLLWLGATPVLCDAAAGYHMSANAIPATVRTAIIPHLFGAAAPLPDTDCFIEDIAQSIGGATGRAGRVTIASFYATKLMTTGEGGMLLTDDAGLAEQARDLRDYDGRERHRIRYACKMTEFQAAMGRVQLRRLPAFIVRRQAIAARYTEAFQGLPLRLPPDGNHVFFRYVVETAVRSAFVAHLQACGVDAKRPVHHPIHHDLGGGEFPGAEHAHAFCVSLPIYPALTDTEIETVIASVLQFHA